MVLDIVDRHIIINGVDVNNGLTQVDQIHHADYCPTCGHRVGVQMHNLADILQRRESGESMASIGNRYGVTRSRIHQIIKQAKEEKASA